MPNPLALLIIWQTSSNNGLLYASTSSCNLLLCESKGRACSFIAPFSVSLIRETRGSFEYRLMATSRCNEHSIVENICVKIPLHI